MSKKTINFAVQSKGKAIEGRSAHKAEGEYTPTYPFLLLKNFNKLLKYFFVKKMIKCLVVNLKCIIFALGNQ
jgi:hypothetical protein